MNILTTCMTVIDTKNDRDLNVKCTCNLLILGQYMYFLCLIKDSFVDDNPFDVDVNSVRLGVGDCEGKNLLILIVFNFILN